MVVDDDDVSLFALSSLFQKMGFSEVIEFKDGQMAWDYLRVNPLPVLCCCDVRMPIMSGIDLLRKVRSDSAISSLAFVLVTSGQDRDTVSAAVSLGVSGYIVKPFTTDDAVHKIEDILSTQWQKIAERPESTLKRLSITAPKLVSYFDAFKVQIDKLLTLSQFTSEALDIPGLNTQISAIHKGCLTLGLWHCREQLGLLLKRSDKQACLENYLLAVISTVNYQIALISGHLEMTPTADVPESETGNRNI